jgi:hypothetical protein
MEKYASTIYSAISIQKPKIGWLLNMHAVY